MSISAEEKNRYLREAAIVLAREGFQTDRTHTGGLHVLLDGSPLCEVTESGGVTYRNEDIDEPERIAAKDKVYEIVRTTAEYMRQMEMVPFLKADGLEDGYIIRLRGEQESDVFSYLSRIEQNINDNGFTTRRTTEQDLKKMLGVYFEQNVTTEKFEDFDGDRWVIVGE